MTVTPIFRSIRDPVGSAARWAVHSVPDHLSANVRLIRAPVQIWFPLSKQKNRALLAGPHPTLSTPCQAPSAVNPH